MIGINFKLKEMGEVLAKKHVPRVVRETLEMLGRKWHEDYRPKHFTHQGAREYGYEPRAGETGSGRSFSGSYTKRKLKKFDHTLPLVYTGRGQDRTRFARIVATSKRVRIVMNAPVFNLRPAGGNINMRDELTRVSPREEREMIRLAGDFVRKRINEVQGQDTTRISA